MNKTVTVTITRPNTTPTYTAGDVIGPTAGASHKFGVEQSGSIKGAILIDSVAPATKIEADLYLFDSDPSVAADDAAFVPTDDQMKALVGVISFTAAAFKMAYIDTNGHCQVTGLDIAYFAPDRKLYGVLVARNGYVAVANSTLTIRLTVDDGA